MRLVYCPGEWKKLPVETLPVCSGCGTPFRKTENQLGDVAWFEADSMAEHISDTLGASLEDKRGSLPKNLSLPKIPIPRHIRIAMNSIAQR